MKAHLPLLALLVGAACSKGGDAPKDDGKVASCNMPSLQSCQEYRGGNLALGTEHIAKLCAIGDFKLTETPCPTASVIGVCAKNEGTDFYYAGYAIPIAKVEASCTASGGTFRAK